LFHARILPKLQIPTSLATIHYTSNLPRARLSSDHDVVQMKVSVREADGRVVWEHCLTESGERFSMGIQDREKKLYGIVECLGIDERADLVAAEVDCLARTMIECA
jgi:hypothetical protein